MESWDPETGQVPGRRQIAERQLIGLLGIGWSLIMLLSFVFFVFSVSSGRSQTSLGGFVLGTIVLHDPQGVLLS